MGFNDPLPPPTAGAGDDANFKYPKGPLAPDPAKDMRVIGGTLNVSVAIDPERALRGEYTPIPGDRMPAGTPVDVVPGNRPYLPMN